MNNTTKDMENNQVEGNYIGLGIALGLCVGSVAMVILAMFGQILWGGAVIGACFMVGMITGMNVKKRRK